MSTPRGLDCLIQTGNKRGFQRRRSIEAGAVPVARQNLGLAPLPDAPQLAGAPRAPDEITDVVMSRCAMCHAKDPGWSGLGLAPKGFVLDTPEDIERNRLRVGLFAGVTNAMPPNNITEMTDDERHLVAKWASLP